VKITGFVWLNSVIDKIEIKHGVYVEEVEEVFAGNPVIKRMEKGRFRGEDVYRALGQTRSGRYLVVFFIHKLTQKALVLSARDMDRKERRAYAKQSK